MALLHKNIDLEVIVIFLQNLQLYPRKHLPNQMPNQMPNQIAIKHSFVRTLQEQST